MPTSTTQPTPSKLPTTTPNTLSLPRILCLHGGGVNGLIFSAQSRALTRHLQHSFRLIWAEGPFLCNPHSDIISVYGSYAPFRRWLRWLPEHSEVDAESAIEEIGYAIRSAMVDDEGVGEWVGLMGFSQGAKLAASLLLEQQARERVARDAGKAVDVGLIGLPVTWRFGILLSGRAPLANLNPGLLSGGSLYDAGGISEESGFQEKIEEENVIRVPTVHVHGLKDPGLHLHRLLYREYCAQGSKVLVEWDGGHRIPIKTDDVERVLGAVYDVAEKTGVGVVKTV